MNRRKFIAGLLASAAIAPALKAVEYGNVALPKGDWLVKWGSETVYHTFIYGTDEAPTQYSGFIPRWSAE